MNPDLRARLRRFVRELKRRKVIRVAIVYVVSGWVVIQVSATIFPHIGLPGLAVTAVIILVALGFIPAVALSWVYELRPEEPEPTAGGTPQVAADSVADAAVTSPPAAGPPDHGYRPPAPAHPLVGRDAELETLCGLVHDHRLVTVLGPGGVGKTRLVLELGVRCREDFADGVCFVPLAAVESAERLVPALALALRLPHEGGAALRSRVVDFLRERGLLLVLDNFEQLADASPLLVEILEAAPDVRIVVTSRERLRLSAEALYPLEPLRAGDDEEGGAPAEELFLQVARRYAPAYTPGARGMRAVRRICRRLEGLPLPIELAAAWVATLGEEAIDRELERSHDLLQAGLRDLPERHRSLHAAMEWSWRLLSPTEREAFGRLSVFRGGFDLVAAEHVAGASRDLLAALQEKSLLRAAGGGRFEILEVLRQHAADKLGEDARAADAARLRHAEYFARVLAAGDAGDGGAPPGDLMEQEVANLRAAWETALAALRWELVERMLEPLFLFHERRGWAREGASLFSAACAALGGGEGTAVLAGRLSIRYGILCHQAGQAAEAREALARGLEAVRSAGDEREVAIACGALGEVAHAAGEHAQARARWEESLTAATAAGDDLLRGRALSGLGIMAWTVGDAVEARRLYGEAIPLLSGPAARGYGSAVLRNLGILEATAGNLEAAERLLHEALARDREAGYQRGIAFALQNLAAAALRRGDLEDAERHLDEAIPVARRSGNRRVLAYCSNSRGELALRRDDPEVAAAHLDRAMELAAEIGDRPLTLQALVGCAQLEIRCGGELAWAARTAAAARVHPAADQDTRDLAATVLLELRDRLDDTGLTAEIAAGEEDDALRLAAERLGPAAPSRPTTAETPA